VEYYPKIEFTGIISLAHRKESRRGRLNVKKGIETELSCPATRIANLWVILVLSGGWGALGYTVARIIMPEEPLAQVRQAPAPQVSPQAAPNR
jgi:phage shock protein PspC (stress-responsive transcriptional regulator)